MDLIRNGPPFSREVPVAAMWSHPHLASPAFKGNLKASWEAKGWAEVRGLIESLCLKVRGMWLSLSFQRTVKNILGLVHSRHQPRPSVFLMPSSEQGAVGVPTCNPALGNLKVESFPGHLVRLLSPNKKKVSK